MHPVFLLDESQLLHQDVLDHLHILANYEWDSKALLSLVMVGLPELNDRMLLRRNRSLFSRVHTRLRLLEATPEDTAEYVAYRMERVGGKQDAFTSDALALLHEASCGRLRDIDRISTESLKRAARKGNKRVDAAVVEQAANVCSRSVSPRYLMAIATVPPSHARRGWPSPLCAPGDAKPITDHASMPINKPAR